jgi:hypothetical protein
LPINQNNIYFIINKGKLKPFETIVFEDSVKKYLRITEICFYPVIENCDDIIKGNGNVLPFSLQKINASAYFVDMQL